MLVLSCILAILLSITSGMLKSKGLGNELHFADVVFLFAVLASIALLFRIVVGTASVVEQLERMGIRF